MSKSVTLHEVKKMDPDSELKIQAMEKAVEIIDSIIKASHDPEAMIAGEARKVYEELKMWEWLEKYPIEEDKNRWLYVTMIAQTQYRHLKWKKEHPIKNDKPKSKWDKVVGRAAR